MENSDISLEALGWRQFSMFEANECQELKKFIPNLDDSDIVIVLPYSCAVVNEDFDKKEPYCEVIVGKTSSRNRGLQFGRNPRKIQLIAQNGGNKIFIDLDMKDRYFIDHAAFKAFPPNDELTLASGQEGLLKSWIAQRYLRSAFPTEFNKRAGAALVAIKERLNALGAAQDFTDQILGIYLVVDPPDEEITDPEEPYEIKLVILVTESGRVDFDSELSSLQSELEQHLKSLEGVHLDRAETLSETVIMLSEFRSLTRIDDYDFISFSQDHQPPIM